MTPAMQKIKLDSDKMNSSAKHRLDVRDKNNVLSSVHREHEANSTAEKNNLKDKKVKNYKRRANDLQKGVYSMNFVYCISKS